MSLTRVNRVLSANNTTTPKLTTAALTCLAGDLITVKSYSGNASQVHGLPTGVSGAVFTQVRREPAASDADMALAYYWRCVVPSDQTVTVSLTRTTGTGVFGFEASQWRGHDGVGASNGTSTGTSGVPSVALTGVLAKSAVDIVNADWNAVAVGAPAYRTTDAGAFTQDQGLQVGGDFTLFTGRHANAGAGGTKTAGMTAPTGQRYSTIAVEIKELAPTGSTYDRSGTATSAAAPSGSVQKVRLLDRSGSTVSTGAPSGSGTKVNPTSNRGTVAVGRIQPVRGGVTVVAVALSGSRAVGTAAAYARSGATVSAANLSGSRSVTPVGVTSTRSGTVAFGRVPVDRAGSTVSARTLSGSRVLGNPGAMFDRSGTVVSGRIARSRTGGVTSAVALSGSRAITPAGVLDRSGGTAGGAGHPYGLLLTLQAHPGPTFSGSVKVDSNVPARSGAVVSAVVIGGARVVRRDRSGIVVSPVTVSGSRVSSGNRNRNGLVGSEVAPSGIVVRVRLSERTGALITPLVPSGTVETGATPVYARSGTVTVPVVLAGRRVVRKVGAKTYIFQSVTTGWVSSPDDEGALMIT